MQKALTDEYSARQCDQRPERGHRTNDCARMSGRIAGYPAKWKERQNRIQLPFFNKLLKLVELVNLCSKDEIALRKTVDFVRPASDLDFPPGKEDIWVVTLLFGELTYAVYELESLTKVRELKALGDVMFLDDVPAVDLPLQCDEFSTLERRDASSAWHACFGR